MTCLAASALNSSEYRLPLIHTSVIAVMYGLEMSREPGAIHLYRQPYSHLRNLSLPLRVSPESRHTFERLFIQDDPR